MTYKNKKGENKNKNKNKGGNKNKNKNKGGNKISTILQNITNIIILAVIFISLYFIIQFAEKINTTNQNIQENIDSFNNASHFNHAVNQNIFEGEPLPSDEQTSFITAVKRNLDETLEGVWGFFKNKNN